MRTPRQHVIDRAIVRGLVQCGSYSCPDTALYETLVISVHPAPLRSEFDESIRYLEAERRIIGMQAETCTKWKLTDEGRLWASEQRIG